MTAIRRRVSMTVPQFRRAACAIDLTRREADVLAFLLASPPDRFIPMNDMIVELWPDPDDEPEFPQKNIGQYLCHLRAVGIVIENDWARGWRIPRNARGA